VIHKILRSQKQNCRRCIKQKWYGAFVW